MDILVRSLFSSRAWGASGGGEVAATGGGVVFRTKSTVVRIKAARITAARVNMRNFTSATILSKMTGRPTALAPGSCGRPGAHAQCLDERFQPQLVTRVQRAQSLTLNV